MTNLFEKAPMLLVAHSILISLEWAINPLVMGTRADEMRILFEHRILRFQERSAEPQIPRLARDDKGKGNGS
jgi:hypothetical protein